MTKTSRVVAALVLATLARTACAEGFGASIAAFADDQDGRSFDLDAAWSGASRWSAGLGVGTTESPSAAGNLDGTSARVFAQVNGDRFGARGYYRQWESSALDTDTTGGRLYVYEGGFTAFAIFEARGLDVDYTDSTATPPERARAHFSGTGWGAGASYGRALWSGYVEGTFYSFGSLTRYVEGEVAPPDDPNPLPTPPSTPGLPVAPSLPTPPPVTSNPIPPLLTGLPGLPESILHEVPTLSGSYVTLGQGVFDRVLAAGLERRFARASLRFDWTGARDAVLDTTINSFSAGYRYAFTARLGGRLAAGVSDSRYGSVAFGGVSLDVTL